jgi:hypothetical protein
MTIELDLLQTITKIDAHDPLKQSMAQKYGDLLFRKDLWKIDAKTMTQFLTSSLRYLNQKPYFIQMIELIPETQLNTFFGLLNKRAFASFKEVEPLLEQAFKHTPEHIQLQTLRAFITNIQFAGELDSVDAAKERTTFNERVIDFIAQADNQNRDALAKLLPSNVFIEHHEKLPLEFISRIYETSAEFRNNAPLQAHETLVKRLLSQAKPCNELSTLALFCNTPDHLQRFQHWLTHAPDTTPFHSGQFTQLFAKAAPARGLSIAKEITENPSFKLFFDGITFSEKQCQTLIQPFFKDNRIDTYEALRTLNIPIHESTIPRLFYRRQAPILNKILAEDHDALTKWIDRKGNNLLHVLLQTESAYKTNDDFRGGDEKWWDKFLEKTLPALRPLLFTPNAKGLTAFEKIPQDFITQSNAGSLNQKHRISFIIDTYQTLNDEQKTIFFEKAKHLFRLKKQAEQLAEIERLHLFSLSGQPTDIQKKRIAL